MNENLIGERVLGAALKVHIALGPGLLESAYETCLSHELRLDGLAHVRQLTLPVTYRGQLIETAYRLDLLVEEKVVVEVKSVDAIADVHRAQLLSYLRLGGYRLGYLLNFNAPLLRSGIVRLANAL